MSPVCGIFEIRKRIGEEHHMALSRPPFLFITFIYSTGYLNIFSWPHMKYIVNIENPMGMFMVHVLLSWCYVRILVCSRYIQCGLDIFSTILVYIGLCIYIYEGIYT